MSTIRKVDHVGILVRDTQAALEFFCARLGLEITDIDEPGVPPVRLTYLACGDIALQLVEPLDATHDLARQLERDGEGLHHICFAVDDVSAAVQELSEAGVSRPPLGSGRGRPSGFIANPGSHGVRIECTSVASLSETEI